MTFVPVADLLAQSMGAHRQALAARQRHDAPTAALALRQAYDLRQSAHALDPEHVDPAWQSEQPATPHGGDTHTVLMAFYEQQLGPRL